MNCPHGFAARSYCAECRAEYFAERWRRRNPRVRCPHGVVMQRGGRFASACRDCMQTKWREAKRTEAHR